MTYAPVDDHRRGALTGLEWDSRPSWSPFFSAFRRGPHVIAVGATPRDMGLGVPAERADYDGIRPPALIARFVRWPFEIVAVVSPLCQRSQYIDDPTKVLQGFL